jgi:hypothetical protein
MNMLALALLIACIATIGYAFGRVKSSELIEALEVERADLRDTAAELRTTIQNLEALNESYQRALDTRRGLSLHALPDECKHNPCRAFSEDGFPDMLWCPVCGAIATGAGWQAPARHS